MEEVNSGEVYPSGCRAMTKQRTRIRSACPRRAWPGYILFGNVATESGCDLAWGFARQF